MCDESCQLMKATTECLRGAASEAVCQQIVTVTWLEFAVSRRICRMVALDVGSLEVTSEFHFAIDAGAPALAPPENVQFAAVVVL